MSLETSTSEFHKKHYTPEIQKLTFHLPCVLILGTHYCGNDHHEIFKRRRKKNDVLCQTDYADRIVSILANQIQSEYYCGNWSVCIEETA